MTAGTSYQGGNDGQFGFFECEDDPEVFAALFDAAEAWLRRNGAASGWSGPMDFTTNDECGLLIEGYDIAAADPAALAPALLRRAARGARLSARRWTC